MPRIGIGLGLGLFQGGGGAAPYVGFLDSYPNAAAAYSLRKLRAAYTGNAIRVRRTDLTEQNIGFNALGGLDTTALMSFVGTGVLDNGFITTWYDQSGNGLNATQTTALNQPQIVIAGSMYTDINGFPSIRTAINAIWMNTSVNLNNAALSTFKVIRTGGNLSNSGVMGATDNVNDYAFFNSFADNNYYYGNGTGAESSISAGLTLNSNFIASTLNRSSTDRQVVTNAVSRGTSNVNKQTNFTMRINAQYRGLTGFVNEIIAYGSGDSLSTCQAKQNLINTYYGIY